MKDSQDLQTQLGRLLQKERSKSASGKVDSVLASDLPTGEKIAKIEEIDSAESEEKDSSGGYLSRSAVSRGKDSPPAESEANPVLDEHISSGSGIREIQRNRSRIKQHIQAQGFVKFLFRDLKKIKKFGAETHTLTSGVFAVSLIANKDVRMFFCRHLQHSIVMEILKITSRVLHTGWKHLTKREYNLVALFHELCREIGEVDFTRLNYKNRYLIDHIGHLERLFLSIQSVPDSLSLLISAIDEVRHKEPDTFENNKGVSNPVKMVLTKDGTLPSLYNFFLGLNMLKYRRYLALNDLIREDAGPVIDSREFDCPPEIISEIKDFVRNCESQIAPLMKQKEEILRLRAFIPSGESDEITYAYLAETYDGYFREKYNRTFKQDKDRMFAVTPGVFLMFLTDFTHLLMEQVALEGVGRFQVFTARCFDIELSKIQSCYERLEKIRDIMPSFPRKRFLILKNSRKGAIESEAEALQIIDDASNAIYTLGNKIAALLRNRMGGLQPEGGFKPLESVVFQGKPFYLPYESGILRTGGILEGRSITEALTLICGVSYLSSIYFMNAAITSALGRERRITDKLSGLSNSLKRVMSPEGYRFIKLKYDLPQ